MVRCAICGVEVESIESAIQKDWVPGFFEYDEEHGPACPSCSESLLRMAEDGEYEVLERYRGKIVYLQDAKEAFEEEVDVSMEDVFLGFILN